MKIILKYRGWCIGLTIFGILLIFLGVGTRHVWTDPDIILLVPEGGAQWVRYREPSKLYAYLPERLSTTFRYLFPIDHVPEKAILTLRAMKQVTVYLDGRLLFRAPDDLQRWKEPHRLDLTSWLTKGSHELRIVVVNENGHPVVLAYCSSLGIRSGDQWEASYDGRRWLPALPVDEMTPIPVSREFPRTDQALRSLLPIFAPLFAFVFFLSIRSNERPRWMERAHISPGAVRWLLTGGWLAMAVNNFWKIPIPFGMDFPGHTQYISYVASYWRVPLATEGWQMFQPPLFYYLEAVIFRLFLQLFEPDTVIRLLKLLPLVCGAAQVEISYRTLRYAYPGRKSLQVIGTLIGGLLPMNLYISQSIGNEPLAGCLTALTILYACRALSGDFQSNRELGLIMGFTLGLAMLTKPTAILIVPPLLFFVSVAMFRKGRSKQEGICSVMRFVAFFLGAAFIVSGWYYVRNYIDMGRFFIGGWDSSREIVWWMNPGYRTPRQFYVFGESLLYPVYSSIYGFWDSIYSSLWLDGFLSSLISTDYLPWNQAFMISSAWLSLLPTAAIIIGVVVAFRKKEGPLRQMLFFSMTCLIVYLAAIFYLFLTVPILSSAKATYALGLTPCFALLVAAGFEVLTRWRFLRAAVYGLIACWAVGAYASYFVI
ncbi:MAG: hypothetical protein A2V87_02155 [Deltaproteobacteria bacterium RBG_16_58_17]|nr:MAG: hypothetical protein A2V87_02155 [Deltaproteobacteria bacterium RBG_16_58_17]OHE19956.1 MAG: hypothetical protein A2X95_01930 [Syntrophobacterales bacterium GWF2_56_9]